MRILLYIGRMNTGGAERQFALMARHLSELGHEVALVTLFGGGELIGDVPPEVEHVSLHPDRAGRARNLVRRLGAPARLARVIDRLAPDVVYSALYPSNRIAHRALAHGGPPLVWGFRIAWMELDWSRRRAFDYGRRHAPEVPLAIFNSRAGRDYHESEGYRFPSTEVIPNGTDTRRYRPDPERGAAWRRSHGLAPEAFVVGSAGRVVDQKDPETFLRAAAQLRQRLPGARFVWVGAGRPAREQKVRGEAARLGLDGDFLLAGNESDMPAFYSAVDLYASTSVGEGFSNSVAEAMSCATPCVVTDVGDSAFLVGDTGWCSAPGEPLSTSELWYRASQLSPAERSSRGGRARARIEAEFTPQSCALRTAQALGRVVRPEEG